MTTESILEEAQRLIHGERATTYGHPRANFSNIADLWTAYLGWEVKPLDVGLMMILMKVARLEQGTYHRDSVTDIAGYAGTLERIFEEPLPKRDFDFQIVTPTEDPETRYRGNRPRIWNFPSDIPNGVVATDKDGDFWEGLESGYRFRSKREGGSWSGVISTSEDFGAYAPFTEVLDG